MKICALKIIKLYQKYLSQLLGPTCRYHQTCSEYAFQAINKFCVFRGGYLALKRILKCNPWGGSGIDEVPGEK